MSRLIYYVQQEKPINNNKTNGSHIMNITKIVSLAVGLALSFSLPGAAASESDFFEGNTVQILIGHSAGGGYDAYGRTLARHIGKHIPGNPDIVVRNVTGAGSLVLMNQVANTLPADGTAIGMVNSGIPFDPLFGNEKARFDINDMSWVGNLDVATTVGAVHKRTGIKSWRDLRSRSMTVGSVGAGANTTFIPKVLSEIFDLNIQVITGYGGTREILLAIERGEVDGIGSTFVSSMGNYNLDWTSPDSDMQMLYQIGLDPHPDLPGVPTGADMASTDPERQAVNLLSSRLVMARPFVAPPGMDKERLATLRQAFADVVKDPDFLADANDQGLTINYVGGDRMLDYYREVYETPDDIVNMIKAAM